MSHVMYLKICAILLDLEIDNIISPLFELAQGSYEGLHTLLPTMSSDVKRLEAQLAEAKAQTRELDAIILRHRHIAKQRDRRAAVKFEHLRQVGLRILATAETSYKALEQWLSVKLAHVE